MAKKEKAETFVKVPLDAAQEAVAAFDDDRARASLMLHKIVLLVEEDAEEEVEPRETLENIRTLVDKNDVPRWYAGLMMGIAQHLEAEEQKKKEDAA